MRVLVWFSGTGETRTGSAIDEFTEWCDTAKTWGAYADLFIIVDGVSMHKLLGVATNAQGWLKNTFYNDLFIESKNALHINPAILDAPYVIAAPGSETISNPKGRTRPSVSLRESAHFARPSVDSTSFYTARGSVRKTGSFRTAKGEDGDEILNIEGGINLNDIINHNELELLDPVLLLANNNKARNSIKSALTQKVETIDLCGFSRGAVMTFLFTKHLYDLSLRRNLILPRINIMAKEPVPGNIFGWGYTMQAHANSLENELDVIQRCVVGLGSYHSFKFGSLNKTLCFNQLCPKPIRKANKKTKIRPVIYSRGGHKTIEPFMIDFVLLYYAGMTEHNPVLLIPKEQGVFDKYAVSGKKKFLGRNINNIPIGAWDSYRIRERDIVSNEALFARLEDLLGSD